MQKKCSAKFNNNAHVNIIPDYVFITLYRTRNIVCNVFGSSWLRDVCYFHRLILVRRVGFLSSQNVKLVEKRIFVQQKKLVRLKCMSICQRVVKIVSFF